MTAAAAVVDTSSSGLGQVVDARRISELPIREGTAVELVILAPGVQNTTDLRSRKAAFNNGLSQWSSDGAGEKRNDFTIDGVANVAADRVAYSPPSAAVEEFKIQTATYDAAVGNAMGASVNLVTKSGTNSLRGQVYEWFRGADLDAPNYFDEKAGRPKRDYKDNRFGAAVGGPIARSRTFYFANVEANPFQVPHLGDPERADREDAQRRFLGAAGARLAVSDLRSGDDPAASDPGRPVHPRSVPRQHHSGRAGSTRSRRTSSGSTRCRIRPARPTAPTTTPTRPRSPSRPITRRRRASITTSRDRHRIYGRFSWDFWEEEKDDRFDNLSTGIFLNRKNRVFAIDDAYTVKNNLLMNVRGGFTRQLFPERRRSQGFDLSSLGFSNSLVSLVPARSLATFPNVTFDGYQAFSPWESGDGFFTTDVYNVTGSADLAGRQPQHEVRHRVPPLRRELEPLPDRGVADHRVRQHLDARAARQLRRPRRAARTSRRSCSACRPAAR